MTFNTLKGSGTPAYCLRFANPAEADWRPEAGTLVVLYFGLSEKLDFYMDLGRLLEIRIKQ